MELIIKSIKIAVFIIASFAAVAGLVNGITGWGDEEKLNKLFGVTLILWLLMVGILYALSEPKIGNL